jgi:ABC-type Fe3+ transport system substrate-binding protein
MHRPMTRREFVRLVGVALAGSVAAACGAAPTATPVPAPTQAPAAAAPAAVPTAAPSTGGLPANAPKFDLSNAGNVKLALLAEGAEVSISSWGFSGMGTGLFPQKFADLTNKLYGVPVKLNWIGGVFDNALRELPVAGKTIADIGLDVIDKEEESFLAAMAVNWYEPIDMDIYKPLVPNLSKIESVYLFKDQPQNGGDIYGAVYQGYEWLQAILRKDKVDVNNYKNWTDLARPELKGHMIDYPFNDSRGHFVFAGFVNEMVKTGKAPGPTFAQPAWEAALKWWKDNNMNDQILKWGDIGNDQVMRGYLQQGTAWAGCLWGVYTRELLGIDWNLKDDVLAPFYPATGILVDRETTSAVRGCKHPTAARILINWMHSIEFNTAGWYKETPGQGEAVNHWDITPDKFLVSYCGGTYKEMRDSIPDQFTKYFYPDPASITLINDWKWYNQNAKWISDSYDSIVMGQ